MTFAGYRARPAQFAHRRRSSSRAWPRACSCHRAWRCRASIGLYHQPPDSADLSRCSATRRCARGRHPLRRSASTSGDADAAHRGCRASTRICATWSCAAQHRRRSAARSTTASGRVYGGELLVRQELWQATSSAGSRYTLSRSERQDHPGDPWRLFQYDQTHILTLLGSYKLPRGFQVGAALPLRHRQPVHAGDAAPTTTSTATRYVPIYGAALLGAAAGVPPARPARRQDVDLQSLEAARSTSTSQNVYNARIGRGRRPTTRLHAAPRYLTGCRSCRSSAPRGLLMRPRARLLARRRARSPAATTTSTGARSSTGCACSACRPSRPR